VEEEEEELAVVVVDDVVEGITLSELTSAACKIPPRRQERVADETVAVMLSKNDEYVITGSERFVETLDIAFARGGGGGRRGEGIANGKRRFDGEELTVTAPIDTSNEEDGDNDNDDDDDDDVMLPPE